jgi:hypothetical protein
MAGCHSGRHRLHAARKRPIARRSALAGIEPGISACSPRPTRERTKPNRGCRVTAETKDLVAQ